MKDILYKEILPAVKKPARYLGTEFNSVHKDPRTVELRVGLVFPDLYELGLGNLGLQILYGILNNLDWCWAERAYAPGPDLESALRRRTLPLFALESKEPLAAMDLLGFSLQSELTYTSVLNILDLAGLPVRARDRTAGHPIIIAGGPAAVNPEPLAPFFDAFVIGDGEDVVIDIAEAMRISKHRPRIGRLERLAEIGGVYVPALHPRGPIRRRLVPNLDLAHFPTGCIVPYTQLVHDRLGLEIMRGCTHGCRFCQAGVTGRPVRARSLDQLDRLTAELLDKTGCDEISLVSLSTCDYPRIRSLLAQAASRAGRSSAAVSVPSLRLDTFSVDLADAVAGPRRSGLTFAPEVATDRLRRLINKWYDDDDLLNVVEESFRRGWEHVKLYFMLGIPTETDDDIERIADLCFRALDRGRAVTSRAKIFTGISTFVPKPFTPLQWAEQIPKDEIRRRQAILDRRFRRCPAIKFGRHAPESTFVEGLLARGDARAAELLETAFKNGARLDSSTEFLNFAAWTGAVETTGYDVAAALGARDLDLPLPWDHIDVGIPKTWLEAEWRRAMNGELTEDCRTGGCRLCGVRLHAEVPCTVMLQDSAVEEPQSLWKPGTPARTAAEPLQRLRMQVGRSEEARFLSHLEFAAAWVRILRRAGAPLAYSQGFHAHPKVTFSAALPLGEESRAEYMDVLLNRRVDPHRFMAAVRTTLPPGFHAYGVAEMPLRGPSLMQSVTGCDYELHLNADAGDIQARIAAAMAASSLIVERKGRPGPATKPTARETDLRPLLAELALDRIENEITVVRFRTRAVNGTLAKPKEILALLGFDPSSTRTIKTKTILQNNCPVKE